MGFFISLRRRHENLTVGSIPFQAAITGSPGTDFDTARESARPSVTAMNLVRWTVYRFSTLAYSSSNRRFHFTGRALRISDSLSSLKRRSEARTTFVMCDLMWHRMRAVFPLLPQPGIVDCPGIVPVQRAAVAFSRSTGRRASFGGTARMRWRVKRTTEYRAGRIGSSNDDRRMVGMLRMHIRTMIHSNPCWWSIRSRYCHGAEYLLEYGGFHVDCANTCHAALDSIERNFYNAVLLDLGLPDGDGQRILHRLQESDPSLPVIVLTATTSMDRKLGSLTQGAFAHLTKPYHRDELRRLHRALA